MTLKVNEIFYSLQGEGVYTGTPAVFLRLSGCNLTCFFCDTLHHHGSEMEAEAIIAKLAEFPSRHLVVTGGEPAMQLTAEFVDMLHDAGFYVQVETNGTLPLPENVDWVTCSPKIPMMVLDRVDEVKLLFRNDGEDDARCQRFGAIPAKYYLLQPLDTTPTTHEASSLTAARRHDSTTTPRRDPMAAALNAQTLAACIAYIKANPRWRLSLQTHKLLHIP